MRAWCERLGRRLDIMIDLGLQATPTVYQVGSTALRYLFSGETTDCPPVQTALREINRGRLGFAATNAAARFGGRTAGGMFTTYAVTGGRLGRRNMGGATKIGVALSNTVIASVGLLLKLAIHTQGIGVSVIDMWVAIFTGRAGPIITSAQYRKLFEAVRQCILPMDQTDYHAFVDAHRELQSAVTQIRDQ
ncbi:MAG: hypothetical protein ACFB2Z_11805 [Maricaulaceae bacterium]